MRRSHMPCCNRVSILFQEVADVGRRHQLEGDIDLLVHRFALGKLECCIKRTSTLARRVLEHGRIEIARLHGGQRILRGIDAADDNRLHVDVGRLHGLDGANGAFVIVGDHAVKAVPVESQLVIRFWASSRRQFEVCLSMILMKLHSGVAITSSMSLVRITAAWFESSPMIT